MPPSPTTSSVAERLAQYPSTPPARSLPFAPPSGLLDIPSIRRLGVRRPGFVTESDMRALPVGGVCAFSEAPRHPPPSPLPVPFIPQPGPGICGTVPALHRSDSSSEREESRASKPRPVPNFFEPPHQGTSHGRLVVANPDPESEKEEESKSTPNRSIANSQPGSSCNTLFLFQDTHPEDDPSILSQFFRDRANRMLKYAAQRAQIEGAEGTHAFGRPESKLGDGRRMNLVAPHTEEIPEEGSNCPHSNCPFALALWSVTGPHLWEGLSRDCDDRSYLLPNHPAHQERVQRHASVRSM